MAKWLNCRLRDLQIGLADHGYQVSLPVISRLLQTAGYRLRVNQKQEAGIDHPDRDRQFVYMRQQRAAHLAAGQPVISVDTKKKELIGDFKNAGTAWRQVPDRVNAHDFPTDALGRAVPYGIYDLTRNAAIIYVGRSADTPEFAVDNIARWCATEIPRSYPGAGQMLIEADSGGSNSACSRVWKAALQERVADRFGLEVTVCHYPRGTSKWNAIEHRVFSEISKTWAGCPLETWERMLHYIRETTTESGLQVEAVCITTVYATGKKVEDDVFKLLNIQTHEVCPTWNYTIRPRVCPLRCPRN